MSSTDITRFEAGQFLALNHEPQEVQTMMKRILGDDTISEFDLPRVRIPAGGGRTWEIPDGSGGVDSTADLQGVIVHHKTTRAYWPESEPNGKPPQCRSDNGVIGVGDPGVRCKQCQFGGQGWGTGKNGRGQACSLYHVLFMLPPGSGNFLPLVVRLPATSAAVMKSDYLVGVLANRLLPPESVVTSLKLERTENEDGQAYSRVVPSIAAELDPDEARRALAYAEAFQPLFDAAAQAVTTEVDGTDPDPANGDYPESSTLSPPESADLMAAKQEADPPGEGDMVSRAREAFGDDPAF